ncbi:hypothetical protein M2404_001190 [Rheinheimera pacifica]|nr:hypothetical protein [Rheinheimera pacifica]
MNFSEADMTVLTRSTKLAVQHPGQVLLQKI